MSKLVSKEKNEVSFPGDLIGVSEEFLPGRNTFSDKEGNIFASMIGLKNPNVINRKLDLKPINLKKINLSRDDIVLGSVLMIKKSSVILTLFYAKSNSTHKIINMSSANVMISRASNEFVENLSGLFKIGDIVKARVNDLTPFGIDLQTVDSDLGVVLGFCSKCRHELDKKDFNLVCGNCGSVEQRKLSDDYNKFEFINEF